MTAVLDLADVATEQWGLVTTAQARALGVSVQAVARLANQGALERMAHGVYRVTGAPPDPLDDLRAAWLALDPERRAAERLRDDLPVVASHRSAATVHELGDLEADGFEFTSAERKQTRRRDVRIHRGRVGPGEWTIVDGLPVTTVVRTVADLAAARVDGGHLASVVRDALTRRQVDDGQLVSALRTHAHRYGAPMGNGEALLTRFLQESGVSVPLGRAVELAGANTFGAQVAAQPLTNAPEFRRLQEQLASIQQAMAPALRIGEQLANSPSMNVVQEAARRVQESSGLQEAARIHAELVNSPAMRAIQDMARQVEESAAMRAARDTASSPAYPAIQQRFQRSDLTEMTRVAEQIRQVVSRPEFQRMLTEHKEETE